MFHSFAEQTASTDADLVASVPLSLSRKHRFPRATPLSPPPNDASPAQSIQSVQPVSTSVSNDSCTEREGPTLHEMVTQLRAYATEYETTAESVHRRRDLVIQFYRYFNKYFVAHATQWMSHPSYRHHLCLLLHWVRSSAEQFKAHSKYVMEVYGLHVHSAIEVCDHLLQNVSLEDALRASMHVLRDMVSPSAERKTWERAVGGPCVFARPASAGAGASAAGEDQFMLSMHEIAEQLELLGMYDPEIVESQSEKWRTLENRARNKLNVRCSSSDSLETEKSEPTLSTEYGDIEESEWDHIVFD